MLELNYTDQGRRPSARQILADWKKAGKPAEFTVEYGETYAHFQRWTNSQWSADGNGCRGVDRNKVEKLLGLEG